MEFKVYKMNDYDTVISPLSKEETNEWYKKEFWFDDEDQSIEEISELEETEGFWEECGHMSEVLEILESLDQNGEARFKRMGSCMWVYVTFKELIEDSRKKNRTEPFVACSTEW